MIAELRVTHQHLLARLLDKSRSAENVVQNSASLRLNQQNDPTELESTAGSYALLAVVHMAEHSVVIAMHTTVRGQVPIGQQHWSKSEQLVRMGKLLLDCHEYSSGVVAHLEVIVTHTTVSDQQPSAMNDQWQPVEVERSQEAKLQLERSEQLLLLVSRIADLIDERQHVSHRRLLDY